MVFLFLNFVLELYFPQILLSQLEEHITTMATAPSANLTPNGGYAHPTFVFWRAKIACQLYCNMRQENLWIDADPSGLVWTGLDCDDDLAILVALSVIANSMKTNNDNQVTSSSASNLSVELAGISICGGNAPLAHTWDNIHALWRYIDLNEVFGTFSASAATSKMVRPVKGCGWQSMQLSQPWLKFLNFVSPDTDDSNDAIDAIVDAITTSGNDSENLFSCQQSSTCTPPTTTEALTILTLGPPTNVAKAIERIEDEMKDQQEDKSSSGDACNSKRNQNLKNLKHVYMMGGELTSQRLDLNFMTDRGAARKIIEAPEVPVTLVPVQLCGQVIVTQKLVDRFESECCARSGDVDGHAVVDSVVQVPEEEESSGMSPRRQQESVAAACAILPKMKQQVHIMPRFVNQAVARRFPTLDNVHTTDGNDEWLVNNPYHARRKTWIPSTNLLDGFIPWDVIAVLVITHPELFNDFEYHRVEFPTCDKGEPCDGTMTIVKDLGQSWPFNKSSTGEVTGASGNYLNHSGIVRIPHTVRNETALLEIMFELLCQVQATKSATSVGNEENDHATSVPSPHQPPPMKPGFLNHIICTLLLVSIGTLSVFCGCRTTSHRRSIVKQ